MTGRVQHRAQANMLRTLGIVFKIRADGSILVLRAHVEAELGAAPAALAKTKEFKPNWDGINA